MDPQVREFLDTLKAMNAPQWEDLPPPEGRRVFTTLTSLAGRGPQLDRVEDCQFNDDVDGRVYRPAGADPLPAIVYFHGGGWVLGDLDTHDGLCRHLASAANAVVVAVNYRRAPEHPYPIPVEDSCLATQWVADHADKLGADPQRLVVLGDSAGGNLATEVALRAAANGPRIAGQVLIYPVVVPNFESESYQAFAKDHGLTRQNMIWFWKQYLGENTAGYRALPESQVADLPQTHVVTAEYDVLRDEGEAFARKLAEVGVTVSAKRYDGVIHGFIHLSGIFDAGLEAIQEIGAVINGFWE